MRGDTAPYFEIRRSRIQGRGAFATRRIRAGTRITEYTGELISQDEANRRYDDDTMGRHHTFLFAIDDDRVIDGAVGGNDSRYINHSCAPNCQAVNEDGRIFIEALTPIAPGEELLYDYAYARTPENDNPESEALYACRCGAPNCRGSILEPPRKTASRRAKAQGKRTGPVKGKTTGKGKVTSKATGKAGGKSARKAAGKAASKRRPTPAPAKGHTRTTATKQVKRAPSAKHTNARGPSGKR